MSASTTSGADRFRLDSARLAAHLIAREDELFGIDSEHEDGFGAAIVQRFRQAQEAGAIGGPAHLEPVVYPVYRGGLIIAVREREQPGLPPAPRRQVASFSLEARDVALPFDESFEECRAAIGRLLEQANALLPSLLAMLAAEAATERAEA